MLKMFHYLKDSWISILAIILLLAGQAICDLSLPDYTSKIVNIGISQGGIEDVAYDAIRESEMDKIFLFTSFQEKQVLLQSYTLLSKDTLDAKEYERKLKKYPILKNENVYEKKNITEAKNMELSRILERPTLIISTLRSEGEEADAMRASILGDLPSDTDVFLVLPNMPQEAIHQIIEKSSEKLEQMPESIVTSGAIGLVKQEYQTIGMNTNQIQTNYIIVSGAKMLGIALLSMIMTIFVGLLGARLSAKLARRLRKLVFEKVVSFSNTEMKQFGTSSLITRTTNDIQQMQMVLVMLLRTVFYAPIIGIGGVIKSVNANSSMAWIIAVAVMSILSLVIVLFAIVMPKFKIVQKLVDKLNLVTREILTGLPVIRAFHNEAHEEKRFDKANKDLTKLSLFVGRTMSFMMPAMTFIMNTVALIILWKGAYSIDAGMMQVGDMMAFIQYTMQIIMSFLMISMISIMLPRASVSAKRIDEVIQTKLVIEEPDIEKMLDPNQKGVIEFKNVSFRYPDAKEDVITDINFVAKPGMTTAFIGSTGSGKSTLINLIPRFYDVSEGSICIDGVDIRKIHTHTLREKIGYVPQKGILFSGTIKSNIGYGKENITDEELKKAADIAQASEFINQLEETYDAPISQGGTNVSGGQKQRLSIARAIAKKPDIYIFDDSFSALDFKTDAALRTALKKITKESTVLIVAQRISTIMHAEQIVVLQEGKIVGMGTHDELMASCKVYQEIALSQLSKEELSNA